VLLETKDRQSLVGLVGTNALERPRAVVQGVGQYVGGRFIQSTSAPSIQTFFVALLAFTNSPLIVW